MGNEQHRVSADVLHVRFSPCRPPETTAALNAEALPAFEHGRLKRLIALIQEGRYKYTVGDYVLLASMVLHTVNRVDRMLAEELALVYVNDPEYSVECAERELRSITRESLHGDPVTAAAAALAYYRLCFRAPETITQS